MTTSPTTNTEAHFDSHSPRELQFDLWDKTYAARMSKMRRSAVRDLFAAISQPGVIALSGGSPNISSLPIKELAEVVKEGIIERGESALQYSSSDGQKDMREVAQRLMAEQGVEVTTDEIIITSGSQQALDFLGRIFLEPGDVVAVEGPTYLGALQAFSQQEPAYWVIPCDAEGMQVDILAERLRTAQATGSALPKFIYTIPNFQNPSGTTLSLERRHALVKLAAAYHIPLVEDDPYGFVRFEGEALPTLKSLDKNVIYFSTGSKIFAPGLRVAWVAAPTPFISRMNLCEQAAGLCVSAFSQMVSYEYFTRIDWHAALQKTRALYKRRRDVLCEALSRYFPREATWTYPQGGLFVWVELPPYFNTEQMLSAALAEGVAYVPGTNCYPNGEGTNAMRLAFSYESEENLTKGVERLSRVIQKRLELYRALMKAGVLSQS